MTVPMRLVAFVLAVVLVAGGGYALGAAVGPLDVATSEHTGHGDGP